MSMPFVAFAAGMGSIALVLSIVFPSVGNWWYLLTLLTPAAYIYYFQKGERTEQVYTHSYLLLYGCRLNRPSGR